MDAENANVIVTAALLVAAVAAVSYLAITREPPSPRRSVVKTLPIALLALVSFVLGGPWLLTLGLALGAIGDWALSRDGEQAFLSGLVAFLLAHLLYVALFLQLRDNAGLMAAEPLRLAAAVLLTLVAAVMLARVWRPAGVLRAAVLIYIATILAMVWFAAWLAPPLAFAGALAFAASDALLAEETFILRKDAAARQWIAPAIWILYCLGQALIAAAFLFAIPVVQGVVRPA
ncbi:MAG TPA: lysoplasmalogenase [Rhizobiaceae bacterium]|nr:lysoplasmalogenase [Rhizobiaceae bacterium]